MWWMTLKNDRAFLLYYFKLCASFQIHRWIQTGVTVWKHSVPVEIGDILCRVTLKFDGWPWKTIGQLFYTTSRFVHHFKPIGEEKLELQFWNAQFGSKLVIFLSRMQFDGWPWKTIRQLFYTTFSFVHHFKSIGEFKLELQSRNVQFGSKLAILCPLKFDDWPWKSIGHLSYAASRFVHHFIALGELKLELQSENAQFGSKSRIIAVWPWNLTDDLQKK